MKNAFIVAFCKYPKMEIVQTLIIADSYEEAEEIVKEANGIPPETTERSLRFNWDAGISTFCIEDFSND